MKRNGLEKNEIIYDIFYDTLYKCCHPISMLFLRLFACVSKTSSHKISAEWCQKSLVTSVRDIFILSSFLLPPVPDQQQICSQCRGHKEGGAIYPKHNPMNSFGEHAGQHTC